MRANVFQRRAVQIGLAIAAGMALHFFVAAPQIEAKIGAMSRCALDGYGC